MKGPLCFSASTPCPPSLQGVVSVQVASLSLHKKGGSGTKKERQRCNKSQPKPLTLTEITAWLVYHGAPKCARHSTFSQTARLGCSFYWCHWALAWHDAHVSVKETKGGRGVYFILFPQKKRLCQHVRLHRAVANDYFHYRLIRNYCKD